VANIRHTDFLLGPFYENYIYKKPPFFAHFFTIVGKVMPHFLCAYEIFVLDYIWIGVHVAIFSRKHLVTLIGRHPCFAEKYNNTFRSGVERRDRSISAKLGVRKNPERLSKTREMYFVRNVSIFETVKPSDNSIRAASIQGDQMSLRKLAQNVARAIFCQNEHISLTV
jgi:hypothetical protein